MQNIIVPMKGRMMHSVAGELTFQPYGKDETEVINSISRAELNIALMNAAEKNGVQDSFSSSAALDSICRTGDVHLRDEETRCTSARLNAELVIGCDGSASAIRGEMLKLPRSTSRSTISTTDTRS